jgi:dihydrofolate reductase
MNETRKYVVSSTLTTADWSNSEIVPGYDASAIRSLKDRIDGDLYVSGSATLVRALLADGLVDALHLFVFPQTLGSGLRLFPDGSSPLKLVLAGSEAYDSGVVHLSYRANA